jgi:hypothetical protein
MTGNATTWRSQTKASGRRIVQDGRPTENRLLLYGIRAFHNFLGVLACGPASAVYPKCCVENRCCGVACRWAAVERMPSRVRPARICCHSLHVVGDAAVGTTNWSRITSVRLL